MNVRIYSWGEKKSGINVQIYSLWKNPQIFEQMNKFDNKYLNIFEYPNICFTLPWLCLGLLNIFTAPQRPNDYRWCFQSENTWCYNCFKDFKSQRASKSHYRFKSYGNFAEWKVFAFWFSFIGGESAINGATLSSFAYGLIDMKLPHHCLATSHCYGVLYQLFIIYLTSSYFKREPSVLFFLRPLYIV